MTKIKKVRNQQSAVSSQRILGKVLFLALIFNLSILVIDSFSQDFGIKTVGNKTDKLALIDNNENSVMGSLANPGSITGGASICANVMSKAYSIALVPGATGYIWIVPSDATIATGQGSNAITVNYGVLGGNVCVYAENACSTSNTNCLIINVSACGFSCGGTLTDSRDGQTYATVSIGSQCWMAQNLNYGSYVAIHPEPQLPGEKFCQTLSNGVPSTTGDPTCANGGLYEWANMMNIPNTYTTTYATPTLIAISQEYCNPCSGSSGVQGLCPTGWHIPTNNEWTTLTNYLSVTSIYWCGGNSTYTGKSLASNVPNWHSYCFNNCEVGCNNNSNNYSGFNALPGGESVGGSFYGASFGGMWWSATEGDASDVWNITLYYYDAPVVPNDYWKASETSVRCIKD